VRLPHPHARTVSILARKPLQGRRREHDGGRDVKRICGIGLVLLGLGACKGNVATAVTPSAQDEAIATMKRGLQPLLSKSIDGLTPRVLVGGGEMIDLEGRFQSAAIAKIGLEGQLEISCVDTIEEAEAFLRAPATDPARNDR
jgi:hypothetical protein